MGRFVPSLWSSVKCSAELKAKQVSPPSRQISLSPHSLCPRGAEQTTANSALLPGLQPQAGAQTSGVPSFLPLGSCEGVRHAPPSPRPGQSPSTADHPPTHQIHPILSRLKRPPEVRKRRAANRRCRRNPEKSLKPSRVNTMDSRGTESRGSFRLSVRTYPTDIQPRHVGKHRPRIRTLGAPTGPHNQTQGCKTGTPERDSHAKPRTHKGTGRC